MNELRGPDSFDLLFVVHQDVPMERLQARCALLRPESVGILSTHAPFPNERSTLLALAPRVRLWCFADLLSDAEMSACDAEATRRALGALPDSRDRPGYAELFMHHSLHLKNVLVRDKLLAEARPTQLFFAEELGIDPEAWRPVGRALPALALPLPRTPFGTRVRRLFEQELHLLMPATRSLGHKPALVLGSIKRVELRADVQRARIAWPIPWRFVPAALHARALDGAVRAWLLARKQPQQYLLCTTIHQYESPMSLVADELGHELLILIDGHHPSNYSAAYVDGFAAGSFVAVNSVSAAWFVQHGRRARRSRWFQRQLRFEPCHTARVHRIMLVINHAGDWSALINRSDTDRLIEGFIELARRLPDKELVIRLHPTMAHPRHEGVDAMRRIRSFVAGCGLANLSVSNASLEEDLRRGDVYVSEYSQVLIDAWASGKLGLAVNSSGRRSFMADYDVLGFCTVRSVEAMAHWFATLDAELPMRVAQQNAAVARFNAQQTSWDEREPVMRGDDPQGRTNV